METLHRLFVLDRLLRSYRHPVPLSMLLERLECSRATFNRLIHVLREQYHYPIRYSRSAGGYYYDEAESVAVSGLWFQPSELQALLFIRDSLLRLQPGLLSDYFVTLGERIEALLGCLGYAPNDVANRIQIIPIGHRYCRTEIFTPLSQATLSGLQVRLGYRDIHWRYSERTVSPQRLVYYRHHWYLDAWCHRRSAFRLFWVAGIEWLNVTQDPVYRMDASRLQAHVSSSYGIFTGTATETAQIEFVGQAARRVMDSEWHPDQRQVLSDEGVLTLWVPYHDARELIMDILRYGPEARVLGPASLRFAVIERLQSTLVNYTRLEQNIAPSSVDEPAA